MQVRELCVQYRARPDLPPFDDGRVLTTPQQLVDFLVPILGQESVEVFVMVCLSTKFHLLGFHEVARGSIDNVHVAPRDIFKAAILSNAAMFVVAHNHPSGDPTPSPDDIAITRAISAGAQLMSVPMLDHIVIGDGRYFSFKEGGQL
jgi:DNA repair protein RadC